MAIKILNKKHIKQQGVFEKVKREIKVLRRFNHPHIIKHFEYVDTASDIFIVLEYAAGGELFDLISKKERVSVKKINICLVGRKWSQTPILANYFCNWVLTLS